MNKNDQADRTAAILAADKVNMVYMKIKVDTRCSDFTVPKSLVEQLKLVCIQASHEGSKISGGRGGGA